MKNIIRSIIRLFTGNGLFPSEKDKYIANLERCHSEAVDDFMRLFSWLMYIENKYDVYHSDGPIRELFDQVWAGEDSPYDKLLN